MSTQRENRIPTEPRFNFVTEKAYSFILEYGYNRFPIYPFKVLEDLSDYVVCLPWSEAKKILKSSDPFHLRETKAEARTIRPRADGKYYIVYDDVEVNSDARIAWTIMHEIGHIVLGHLTDFGETALDRGGLTQKKYGVLEVEAHYFAAEFLMPTALLKYFSDISIEEIALLFGVSEEAAKKKHKRVFDTSYMPRSSYDELLIRNFFDFLDNDIDGTIYRNIYGTWGIPNKSKYVTLCRKCPDCLTYIADRNAVYCFYCGADIEKKKAYSNMFARLSEQQKFAKVPGVSRPQLPYIEVELIAGQKSQRVKFCPNCLSHDVNNGAVYCKICGSPLYNVCSNCGKSLSVNECFCVECGTESAISKLYCASEERLNKIKDCSSQPQFSEEWFVYPYWGYVRMRLSSNREEANDDLKTALLYSMAYVGDDDAFIVYADTLSASAVIFDNQGTILDFIRRVDNVDYTRMEVYIFQ
ncbi:MAG TPA: ImmA/IrrE family metallo-endopeptidase [Clostridiales bacterium]|nr:ImmA/IrrE family metallo-endopeptidase [Clostridiales bacterium]